MKSRYVFVLALFLFCSCANANNADVIAKATQEAEVAANRAEASANAAEISSAMLVFGQAISAIRKPASANAPTTIKKARFMIFTFEFRS